MTIEQQIANLEIQKLDLQKEFEIKKLESFTNKVKTCIGKYYKKQSALGYKDSVTTNRINYILVRGIKEVKLSEEATLVVKAINIAFSPVGWTRKTGKLSYENPINTVQLFKNQISLNEEIGFGKEYSNELFNLVGDIKDNYIMSGYNRRIIDFWYECTKAEYIMAENICNEWSKKFYKEASKLWIDNQKNYCHKMSTEETEGIFSDIDSATIKRIDDLLSQTNINFKDLKNIYSGKISKWNYFNNTTLPELAQYTLHGDKGLSLEIKGGDDESDYEPYITKYLITFININWEDVLYPIRTKLVSVLDTAKQLRNCKKIYNVSNWNCNYDTSTYDAQFRSAKLDSNCLKLVNDIIFKNLK